MDNTVLSSLITAVIVGTWGGVQSIWMRHAAEKVAEVAKEQATKVAEAQAAATTAVVSAVAANHATSKSEVLDAIADNTQVNRNALEATNGTTVKIATINDKIIALNEYTHQEIRALRSDLTSLLAAGPVRTLECKYIPTPANPPK